MFGYVGLGPGQELIPYFLALLGFIAAAVIAVVQWPFLALTRLIRGKPAQPPVAPPPSTSLATSPPPPEDSAPAIEPRGESERSLSQS